MKICNGINIALHTFYLCGRFYVLEYLPSDWTRALFKAESNSKLRLPPSYRDAKLKRGLKYEIM